MVSNLHDPNNLIKYSTFLFCCSLPLSKQIMIAMLKKPLSILKTNLGTLKTGLNIYAFHWLMNFPAFNELLHQ